MHAMLATKLENYKVIIKLYRSINAFLCLVKIELVVSEVFDKRITEYGK